MDISTHLQWFAHGQDPVTWLRMMRIVLLTLAGVLMFIEPMVIICKGRNQWFHRLVGSVFLVFALYSWGIAKARMVVLVADPKSLATVDLLVYEVIATAACLVLVGRLMYDYYRWKTFEKVKHQPHECVECKPHFEP